MTMQNKHNILFPIETINRELDFRLVQAGMFVTPQRRIFIGSMRRINRMIGGLQGGLYVGKHIFYKPSDYLRFYSQLRERRLGYVYLSEEGAVFAGNEGGWRRALDSQYNLDLVRLSPPDHICNWGEFQTRHYRTRLPQMQAYLHTTGHPRFDLNKPQYRAYFAAEMDDIRRRFGRYVLINTNLSLPNHSRGLATMFNDRAGYKSRDPEARLNFVRRWAHTSTILARMVALVHRLSLEFPQHAFVLRPHPVENIDFYRTVLHGLDNVFVEHEGPVSPWILAADALIHDGCTTAIEASLAEKPVINYKSVEDARHDLRLPNSVGERCTTEDEVLAALKKAITDPVSMTGQPVAAEVGDLMHNFGHNSLALFMDVMERALAGSGPPGAQRGMADICMREGWARLRELPKEAAHPFSSSRREHDANRQKYYGLDQTVVTAKLAALQQLLNKPLQLRRISQHLLVMDAG